MFVNYHFMFIVYFYMFFFHHLFPLRTSALDPGLPGLISILTIIKSYAIILFDEYKIDKENCHDTV